MLMVKSWTEPGVIGPPVTGPVGLLGLVGFVGWDRVGRMLYLADFLETGRRRRDSMRAAQADRVPNDPDGVLREVARDRIAHGIKQGWPLLPETVAFWNALT